MDKFKEKIKTSYLYIVFIQRVLYGNGSAIRNITSAFLMTMVALCCAINLNGLKYIYFYRDAKPLSELTKNTGIMESANYNLKGDGKLKLRLDDSSIILYYIDKREDNIYSPLINKRVTIYSKTMPLGEEILQLEDNTTGKIHIEYSYEEELKAPEKDKKLMYTSLKIAILLLLMVWFLNRKDFTKANIKNNKNKFERISNE